MASDGKAQRPEGSAEREARSEPIPTPEGQGGGRPDRLIAYRAHGLSGKWRAQKIRYGSYAIQVELPCINGLSAWFTIGTIHEADEAERMMTDGARLEARDYAEAISALLSSPRVEEVRREALEEAAKVAETLAAELARLKGSGDRRVQIGSHLETCATIAAGIRALSLQVG